jgi:RNA polymerase sigma-70 factor (ECF subfamily)
MDAEARFGALFEETYPAVARYAHRWGYRGADAEDLIAATFEVAWRRLEKVPEGEAALPWLLTVTRNLSRNRRRRAVNEQALARRLEAAATTSANSRHAGEESDGVSWSRGAVDAALARLKPIDRELVLLVACDELTPAQAGRILGLRPVAARSRLHRARKRLAALLESDGTAGRARAPRGGRSPTTVAITPGEGTMTTHIQENARW